MFTITSNSGHVAYGTKDFVCDTIDDIQDLPIDISAGSTAFVIEGSKAFVLNNEHEWKEI